jgi:hypothetical protein
VVGAGIAINKLLLFAPPQDFASVREDAEAMFEGDCAITTVGLLQILLATSLDPAEVETSPRH